MTLHRGPAMLLLNPFTPQERIVPLNSPEAREWRKANRRERPTPSAYISKIDYRARTVTLNTVSCGSAPCFIENLDIPEECK